VALRSDKGEDLHRLCARSDAGIALLMLLRSHKGGTCTACAPAATSNGLVDVAAVGQGREPRRLCARSDAGIALLMLLRSDKGEDLTACAPAATSGGRRWGSACTVDDVTRASLLPGLLLMRRDGALS
jgi:hypothetical protein